MNKKIVSVLAVVFLMLAFQLQAQTATLRVWQRTFEKKVSYNSALLNFNGQTITTEELLKVPDSTIISVEVLDKTQAVNRFGNEGKKGAILVKTYTPKPLGYSIDSTADSKFFIASGDTIYLKATTEANFDSNGNSVLGWRRLLEKNLNGEVPINNGAPSGYYKVPVRFIVNKDGTVSDVDILANPGYGAAKEVYRVISSSTGWQPALYKGKPVRCVVYQSVTFIATVD